MHVVCVIGEKGRKGSVFEWREPAAADLMGARWVQMHPLIPKLV